MTKHYIIRHKATQKQLFTAGGKKGAWKTPGHAKAAFTNTNFSYWSLRLQFDLDWKGCRRFDEQDEFEIVAVETEVSVREARITALLENVLTHLDDTHGYDTPIYYEIREFLGYKDE